MMADKPQGQWKLNGIRHRDNRANDSGFIVTQELDYCWYETERGEVVWLVAHQDGQGIYRTTNTL